MLRNILRPARLRRRAAVPLVAAALLGAGLGAAPAAAAPAAPASSAAATTPTASGTLAIGTYQLVPRHSFGALMTTQFSGPRRRVVQRFDPVATDTKFHWVVENPGALADSGDLRSRIRSRYLNNMCMEMLPSLIIKAEVCSGSSAQNWDFYRVPNAGGVTYRISLSSQLVMSVEDASTAHDAPVVAAPLSQFTQFHQEFILRPVA